MWLRWKSDQQLLQDLDFVFEFRIGGFMKNKIKRVGILFLACLVLFMVQAKDVNSKSSSLQPVTGDPFEEIVKIRCTCYTDTGLTASGAYTRRGVMAGKSEWLGCVAMVYEVEDDGSVGDFIGYFEMLDTGAGIDTDGDGVGDSIRSGKSIDVWQPNQDAVSSWSKNFGDYVYIKLIKGVG